MKRWCLLSLVLWSLSGSVGAEVGGPSAVYDEYYAYFDAEIGYLSQLDCQRDAEITCGNCRNAGLQLDEGTTLAYNMYSRHSAGRGADYWYWRIFFKKESAPKGALLLYTKTGGRHVYESGAIGAMLDAQDQAWNEARNLGVAYIQLQLETFPVFRADDKGHLYLAHWTWELYYARYDASYRPGGASAAAHNPRLVYGATNRNQSGPAPSFVLERSRRPKR